jgi:rare lipoprotein A
MRQNQAGQQMKLILALLLPTTANAATASWYGRECAGRRMADGRMFDPGALTCASWFYPLGAVLRVSSGGRTVDVRVTDRGPARRLVRRGRVIDLSRAAFARLAPLERGVIEVNVTQ